MIDDESGDDCACGAVLCICNPFEAKDEPNAYPGAAWTFGRCAKCTRDRSIATRSRTCEPCSTAATQSYFASDEAAEVAAAILGTPMPARRKAAA